MKIVVVGLGYVGLSNAVLLAQHNEVIGVDISQSHIDMINMRKPPFSDNTIREYFNDVSLDLKATSDLDASVVGANYVLICVPTNYNENTNSFDTTSLNSVIKKVIKIEPNACIVIKSTIPVGYVDDIRNQLETKAVIFSPEFLREGSALNDNLFPTRIVVGEKSKRAEVFSELLIQGAVKKDVDVLFTGAKEAESIKLFSNAYLAMRVAFFNELDSYALTKGIDTKQIIKAVSLDPRIGNYYNNPSFGYGGYCLPKDTKQILANFEGIPQNIIKAIVDANLTRMDYLVEQIYEKSPKVIGIYKLGMKSGSDNFRTSSILGIISRIKKNGTKIIIYEPSLEIKNIYDFNIEKDLSIFKQRSDIILTNRYSARLDDVIDKVFTRDIFGSD